MKKPPTFTDLELHYIAWMVGSIAWMPDRWTDTISSVAKKIRAYCGDEAVSINAKPPMKRG